MNTKRISLPQTASSTFYGRIAGLILIGMACATPARAAELTYADLVGRLTNLEHLAILPETGERTAQWSSYDRASTYDEPSRKYIRWDANGDGDGYIRKEGDQFVLAEMAGPGCLWRIWSAMPKQGHVRIYLDGNTKPAVDLPFTGYFSGTEAPFNRTALVHTVARGCNNYTPIPYQKSCRITADAGWGQYFLFGYTTFPEGTQVPTFQRELSPEDNAALNDANRQLSQCGPRQYPNGHSSTRGSGTLSGEKSASSIRLDGAGAITGIRVRFDPPLTPAHLVVLREASIQIAWDGEPAPSVWAPLGDFFGTAPGANAYRSLPSGYTEDGWFYANWFMPFTNGADLKFMMEGTHTNQFTYEIYTEELKGDPARYGRFHAKWHRDEFLPTEIERQIDWPVLKTTGRGRYVGMMLHVWNPRGGWWGEGDEKFFVDGEKFPSTFGTGSEDYFGYAWCDPGLFQHAYHNQTRNDGNNRGHVSVNRWHIADQVPFQKEFTADIEKYFANTRPTRYAATMYWYLAADGFDPYVAVPVRDRTNYFAPVMQPVIPGLAEAESLKITALTGGKSAEQEMFSWGDTWSQDAQLWWTGTQPGQKLDLALSVTNTAEYQILAQFTRAIDYGIVQIWMDGEKLGDPIDLFHDGVKATGELRLGQRKLTVGDHTLTLEIIGANPDAVKSYMVGLDYVRIAEVK